METTSPPSNTSKEYPRIMLDLETLGTSPGCMILSIGAVAFNSRGVIDTFYARIGLKGGVGYIDPTTLLWWNQQSKEARDEAFNGDTPHRDALNGFRIWAASQGLYVPEIWGNGAAFDNAILAEAYRVAGISMPWKHRHDRCYRSVKALHPEISEPKREGVYHNALDDALHQVSHLITLPSFKQLVAQEHAA